MNKKSISNLILNKRLSIDNNSVNIYSKEILLNFLKFNISKNFSVAGYYPIKNEVNDLLILDYLQSKARTTLLPCISKNSKILSFKKYSNELINGEFNIKEPNSKETFLPDVILAPLVAFDDMGNRLGYGGGYYDSTLNYYKSINHKVLYIGLAYSFCKVKQIEAYDFDVKLDAIITDKEYKYFDRSSAEIVE